ncbi:MAG: DUF4402 domain-containing protein [Sphingorhabdus sp.]
MCGAKLFSRLKLACAAAAIAAFGMALPVHAESTPVGAETVVVTPLSFIEVDDLKFGTIIPSTTSGGNVVLAPDGTRTANNGIILVGNSHSVAEFAGQGTQNQIVDISVGANTIWLYGPGPRMRVRRFRIGSTPTTLLTTTPRFFRIGSPTGIFRFPVGAELRVRRNQPAGLYTGTWDITLNYQ